MKFVHFIGIEGIGLSGAAKILLQSNVKVSGSDLRPGKLAKQLHKDGAIIYWGHARENIHKDIDLVVVSNAIKETNPEFSEAKKQNIEVITYPELLGVLMQQKKIGIAVAGTHGKTTTSALISYIFHYAQKHPSFLIGGYVQQLESNANAGEGDCFIAEACEYKRSFLHLKPHIGVITNIELDHFDYYKNINDVNSSFISFIKKIDQDGLLVIEKKAFHSIEKYINCPALVYSAKESAPVSAKVIELQGEHTHFVVKINDHVESFNTRLCGKHNIENCLAAITVASYMGISPATISQALEKYTGVTRRFEILQKSPFVVVDDYAHHPTEIVSVIDSAKEKYPRQKIWCVFQPHQASRTYKLLPEFASAFYNADEIIISDIFYARDSKEDEKKISGSKLVNALCENLRNAHHISRFDSIKKFLLQKVEHGDVVLCLGAGNITHFAHELVKKDEF